MDAFIAAYLDRYGPYAVFLLLMLTGIGVPVGEDLVVIPAGALVGHGHMQFWPTVLAAYLGVVSSDALWFGICFRYGTRLLHKRAFKRLVHPRRLLEAKHQMDRRGAWMVAMARFIPGSRTTTITVAGILHMPFWKFILATGSCALVTAPIQVGVGILSARMLGVTDTAELFQLILGLVLLSVAAMLVMGLWRRHRRSARRAPRAKAKWLRHFHLPTVRGRGVGGVKSG